MSGDSVGLPRICCSRGVLGAERAPALPKLPEDLDFRNINLFLTVYNLLSLIPAPLLSYFSSKPCMKHNITDTAIQETLRCLSGENRLPAFLDNVTNFSDESFPLKRQSSALFVKIHGKEKRAGYKIDEKALLNKKMYITVYLGRAFLIYLS